MSCLLTADSTETDDLKNVVGVDGSSVDDWQASSSVENDTDDFSNNLDPRLRVNFSGNTYVCACVFVYARALMCIMIYFVAVGLFEVSVKAIEESVSQSFPSWNFRSKPQPIISTISLSHTCMILV